MSEAIHFLYKSSVANSDSSLVTVSTRKVRAGPYSFILSSVLDDVSESIVEFLLSFIFV